MHEIIPNVGYGTLRLGMSPDEVARLIGPPVRTNDPSADSFLDKEELPFFRGQLIEERDGRGDLDLWDLLYLKGRLVAINIKGASRRATIDGRGIAGDRMELLTALADKAGEIWIRSENYWFDALGLTISRAKNRRDINYVRVEDQAFKRPRLAFELYKRHVGPLIR